MPALARAHPFRFASAFPLATDKFTTFTGGFVGTLDYVLVGSDRLRVAACLPGPTEADMAIVGGGGGDGGDGNSASVANARGFMPSALMPSDHFPVVCDVQPV